MKDTTLALPLVALTFVICWTQGHLKCLPSSDSSEYREVLINQFKKKILKRLGYSSPPNVTAMPSDQLRKDMAHQFMMQRGIPSIDSQQEGEKLRTYRALNGVPLDVSSHFPDVTPLHTSTFHIGEHSPRDHLVEKAWLSFCKKISTGRRPLQSLTQKGRLLIYQLEHEDGSHRTGRHLVVSRPVTSLSSACMTIDVTETLRKNFTGDVTFVLVFINGRKSSEQAKSDRKSLMSSIRSTLLVNLAERGKDIPREKREVGRTDCTANDGEKRCCRYHTYISFKEIAWDDWVVAPPGYDAYYCAGECPHRYKMAHTFAGIKSLLHHMDPTRVPPPTCTATRLRPLTLLSLDEVGKMTYSDHPEMIVDECKCS
ncbi:protein DVR-1-like [Haliotis rufescens]|uniref:protein DVR-1-like n=1 Tax=Haliotis rufescens TaxID=6454 RepID=UPI001EAF9920|nr:protein DVR-1-like [Haliotis rufescens]